MLARCGWGCGRREAAPAVCQLKNTANKSFLEHQTIGAIFFGATSNSSIQHFLPPR